MSAQMVLPSREVTLRSIRKIGFGIYTHEEVCIFMFHGVALQRGWTRRQVFQLLQRRRQAATAMAVDGLLLYTGNTWPVGTSNANAKSFLKV
jgi:hypothetical protein